MSHYIFPQTLQTYPLGIHQVIPFLLEDLHIQSLLPLGSVISLLSSNSYSSFHVFAEMSCPPNRTTLHSIWVVCPSLCSISSLNPPWTWYSCIPSTWSTLLQCSCLENPRDGGAWWAAVSGVAQSQTRLKRLSSSSSSSSSTWYRAQLGEHGQWAQVILKKISHISWDKIFQVVLLTFHVFLKLHSILCINLKEKKRKTKRTERPTRTSVVVLWIFWLTVQNLTFQCYKVDCSCSWMCIYIHRNRPISECVNITY